MEPEQQAVYVYYENDKRKFKMVMKGDVGKLPVEKIKRYLTNATGLSRDQQVLSFEGHELHDDLIGEEFGLIPNATLTLHAREAQRAAPGNEHGGGPAAYSPTAGTSHVRQQHPEYSAVASSPQQQQQQQQQQPFSAPTTFHDAAHATAGAARSPGASAPSASAAAAGRYPMPASAASSFGAYGYTATASNSAAPAAVLQQHQQQQGLAAAAQHDGVYSRNTALEEENMKLRMELQEARRSQDATRRSQHPHANVLANAKANLVELGNELGLHLSFDANLTCVVGSEEKNTILVTFDAATERLYLYSTLLTYIPEDAPTRLRLYEALLEGALLGRDMAGGGCGVSLQSGIVMMSTTIDLRHVDAFALRDVTPRFVEALVRWRGILSDLLEKNTFKDHASTMRNAPPSRTAPPPPPHHFHDQPLPSQRQHYGSPGASGGYSPSTSYR